MSEEEGYKATKTDYIATVIALILLVVGYVVTTLIQNSMADLPEGWGPPSIIVWMPLIFCSIPLIICIICWVKPKKATKGPEVHRYRDETMVYTGDYQLDTDTESKEPEKVYLIPAECPSCQKPISEANVDWVGPLKAKCPYCETIIDAQEKTY